MFCKHISVNRFQMYKSALIIKTSSNSIHVFNKFFEKELFIELVTSNIPFENTNFVLIVMFLKKIWLIFAFRHTKTSK